MSSAAPIIEFGTHPVIELIASRARCGSQPTARSDGAVLGLAFEGGSMRGIISAGMGLALVQLGLTDVFDVVLGASAGAMNGAYFVSRQGAFGITIYYEDINNERFFNMARPFTGRPAVSLDYLFNDVLCSRKPLDFDAISSSQIPLRIIASNITKRRAVAFDSYQSRHDLFRKLRASASIPLIAGPPVEIDGDIYSDASLYESIPFLSAIDDAVCNKCTHVLVLRSRPEGALRPTTSFLQRSLLAKSLRRYNPDAYSDLLRSPLQYAEHVQTLTAHTKKPTKPPFLYQVTVPEGVPTVSPFEKNRTKLVQAATHGMKAMLKALALDTIVMELITPLTKEGRSFIL